MSKNLGIMRVFWRYRLQLAVLVKRFIKNKNLFFFTLFSDYARKHFKKLSLYTHYYSLDNLRRLDVEFSNIFSFFYEFGAEHNSSKRTFMPNARGFT